MTVCMERFCESLFYMTDTLRLEQVKKYSVAELEHQKKIADLTSKIAQKKIDYERQISYSPSYEGGIISLGFVILASCFENDTLKEITLLAFGIALGAFISRKEVILEADKLVIERKKFEQEKFVFEIEELEKEKSRELKDLEWICKEKKKWEDLEEVIQEEKQKRFYSL